MSPALGSRLSNDSIRKREATIKANERAARLALAEKVREALVASAIAARACVPDHPYSPNTCETCDWHRRIADILNLVDLSKIVEGESDG